MIPQSELRKLKRIAGRANPRLKDWAALGEAKYRERLGLTLAEGVRLCREGLTANNGILEPAALLISDHGGEQAGAGEIFELAGQLEVERISLADDCYHKISGLKSPDGLGLILNIRRDARAFAEAFRQPGLRGLVAAGVQDPGNAGALARTALAAGCTLCVFVEGADPTGPKFLRGSMGAAFHFPCFSVSRDEFAAAWNAARAAGSKLVLASAALPAEDYRRVPLKAPFALLVGGEGGVPEDIAGLGDARVHIPLRGGVESLNLAVAAGIILFAAE